MITIPLWPAGEMPVFAARPDAPDEQPTLTMFPLTGGHPRACVLVCPGGGYHGRAAHEGAPVAHWLNRLGVAAAVLAYRVKHRFPASLRDAQRGIRLLRERASEWNLDPQRVGILGFSAGGHLAASAATLATSAADRPNAAILCYPVISSASIRHHGSIEVLLGAEPWAADAARQVSLEHQVTTDTPPCFLWHTSDDRGVPVANSLRFAEALAACGVPHELHVFPRGLHGLGLAGDDPTVSLWTDLCGRWLADLGWRS